MCITILNNILSEKLVNAIMTTNKKKLKCFLPFMKC